MKLTLQICQETVFNDPLTAVVTRHHFVESLKLIKMLTFSGERMFVDDIIIIIRFIVQQMQPHTIIYRALIHQQAMY